MKLAITSDLHVPITSTTRIMDLVYDLASFEPDALVVAGDVAESLADLDRCLQVLKRLDRPVLVLAGNHDLWAREYSSKRLWEDILPDRVQQADCHWLEGKAFVRDGIAVAGTIAWYDYSAVDPTIQTTPETFAREKRYFNMDGDLIKWDWSDPQFAARVSEPFLATLDRLEADPAVRQVVVVTHVPLLECQMCRRPDNRDWGFSNAYFGNLTLGQQVLTRKKVTHIISGHTHVGRKGVVDLPDNRQVTAQVLNSQYGDPECVGLELFT